MLKNALECKLILVRLAKPLQMKKKGLKFFFFLLLLKDGRDKC